MLNKRFRGLVVLGPGMAVTCLLIWGSAASPLQQDELLAMEAFLRKAEVVKIDRDEDLGTTDPWVVWLEDGTSTKLARFKYTPRCRPHILADCYKYELAAYELSKLLGLYIVPPVVERTIDETTGALQIFLEDCISLENYKDLEVIDSDQFHREMLDVLVFDNLTYWQTGDDNLNEDILIHGADHKICRVDFAKAFEPKSELLPVALGREVKQCSGRLYAALEALALSDVRERLGTYLNEDELEALMARRGLLLQELVPLK